MPKFRMTELVDNWEVVTARLGSGTIASGGQLADTEKGKFVKLVAESRFNLCLVGDEIEGWITSVEVPSYDGFIVGGVARAHPCARKEVIFDGLQATPGTGVLAIGDYVVTGTPVAKGTGLVPQYAPRVCKATDQAAARNSPFANRVVSLGDVGTGAVGTFGTIEVV